MQQQNISSTSVPHQKLIRWWGRSDTLLSCTSTPSDAFCQSKTPPKCQVPFLQHWPTHEALRFGNKGSFLSILFKDWLSTNCIFCNSWPIACTSSGSWAKHTVGLKIWDSKNMLCSKCLKWSLTKEKYPDRNCAEAHFWLSLASFFFTCLLRTAMFGVTGLWRLSNQSLLIAHLGRPWCREVV